MLEYWRNFYGQKKSDALLAFQIAFDLIENDHQAFLLDVRRRFSLPRYIPSEAYQPVSIETESSQDANAAKSEDTQMEDGNQAVTESSPTADPKEVTYAERLTKLKEILSGETSILLTLQFLYSHNK